MLVWMFITKLITSKSTPRTMKVIPKEGSTCSDFLSLLFIIIVKLNVKYSRFAFISLKKRIKVRNFSAKVRKIFGYFK